MLNIGKMTQDKFDTIMKHGDTVLNEIGVIKSEIVLPPEHFPESNGGWDKWYFEFEGEKHFSKFKDYADWEDYYTKQNNSEDK